MRFWPRNNENVLIVGRVLADIRDLLVYVTFNATAQRRIKLRQIADFQGIGSASANRITRNANLLFAPLARRSSLHVFLNRHSPIDN